ncbi:hypothetical protein GCM10020000_12300 [Streptomyces olivoverticillatus]
MPVPVRWPSATRPLAQPKFQEAMYWVPAMDSMGIREAVAIHTAQPVMKPSTGPCEMEPKRAMAPGSG